MKLTNNLLTLVEILYMNNETLVNDLKKTLADTYALYLKTQNYHWNVTGPNFESLHLLLEAQYKELAEAIDLIAERIRALGAKTPASFSIFNQAKTIPDGDESGTSPQMVKALADDQVLIINTLKQTLSSAQAIKDEVSINILVDRIQAHEKNHWMLESSL